MRTQWGADCQLKGRSSFSAIHIQFIYREKHKEPNGRPSSLTAEYSNNLSTYSNKLVLVFLYVVFTVFAEAIFISAYLGQVSHVKEILKFGVVYLVK